MHCSRAKIVLLVIVLAGPNCLMGQTELVSGYVVNEAGTTLSDVSIIELSKSRSPLVTGPDGVFHLSSSVGPVLIEHPSYAPVIFWPSRAVTVPIKIVLRDRSTSEWRIPRCKTGQYESGPLKTLHIIAPAGVKERRSTDADYELILFRDRSGRFELRFWKHVLSRGWPHSLWLRGLNELSVRPILLGDIPGYDIVGATEGGLQSRWIGFLHTVIQYSEVSQEVASTFDAMIDGACYR